MFLGVVACESFRRSEALSPAPLPFRGASVLVLEPAEDSEHFLGARALLARRRAPLSLGAASSGVLFTLSCRCETVRVMPGALATEGASVLVDRDEEATVFRAKLGMGAWTRGTLGAGGRLGSSWGLPRPWELEQQILLSSGFCLGTFLRGLALGFLTEPLRCSGGSFPGRALLELPLARGSLCSSATAPDPVEGLLGDVSEVPLTELRRDHGASVLPGVSRGGRVQPAGPLPARESGTTLRMLSLSDAFRVRTGLGAAPWPRRALAGLEAPWDASLREFLFGPITSFPLAGLSLGRPPLELGWLFTETGAGASLGGLEAGLEETWLPAVSPAPEDMEPSRSPPASRSPGPGLESAPSEESRVSEQSVVSEM